MRLTVSSLHKQLQFFVDIESDYDEVHYFIRIPQKRYAACVHIVVDLSDTSAYLAGVSYAKTCNTMKTLKDGHETIMMLQEALQYIFQKHSDILSITLQDDAYKVLRPLGKRISITPRRLLTGKPGWYQEHFGAVPIGRTVKLLKILQRNVALLTDNKPPNWGSYQETNGYAEKFMDPKLLYNTDWMIHRKTVEAYNVQINERMDGGSHIKEYVCRRVNNTIRVNPYGKRSKDAFRYNG